MGTTLFYDKTNLDLAMTLDSLTDLASGSEAMRECLELAQIACKTSAPVMITGETGVGKSLLALAIHHTSPRRLRPCVTLNCSRLRENDLKTRLFGEVREDGTPSPGLLGKAANGTLIIDAVDFLPEFVQRELLAVLVGESRNERPQINVPGLEARLISTRGGEQPQKAAGGNFVEDLIYCLGEITIRIPPLRARCEDIPALCVHALAAANRAHGKSVKGISRTAHDFLRHYEFPGNIRELFLIVDRAVKGTSRDTIYVEDLGVVVDAMSENPHLSSDMTILPLAEMEKRHINLALLRTGWKRRAAAQILHISEAMLNRKIRLYGLERGNTVD